MNVGKWLLVSHCLVVGALAASEAQLKFVPVPVEKRRELKQIVEPLRSSPSASSHHATVVPISNSSIRVSAHDVTGPTVHRGFVRTIHADSHDPGRLHAAASYQQPHRGDRGNSRFGQFDYQSGLNDGGEHSRNFRGFQSPRVDVDLHGSHYPGPAYRHRQGGNLRENRVEVRIDDFRRDQSTQRFQTFQNRPQEFHGGHHSQRGLDTGGRGGGEWQQDRDYRQPDRDFRQPDRDYRQQNAFHRDQDEYGDRRDESRQSFRPDEGQSQSCGPQSPCHEPNGLFPVDGNCCGFVNCANCRPYTQRCAAGTVFDLDLWICNHERDTRQCAGNNRDCAFQTFNLRGQSQQDYDNQDDGPPGRGHDGNIGASNNNGWEYASASEVKEVKKRTGKVSRVKKLPVKPTKA